MEEDVRKCRRAHHVLAYIVQYYIHSLPPRNTGSSLPSPPPIVIPAPIAIPFIASSRRLGIAPVVTYADTVLWNWEKIDPTLPLSRSNIRICDLFTGSLQEEHFFLTSARVEIRGWEALDAMESCVKEAESNPKSVSGIIQNLRRLSAAIDDITTILLDVRKGLDPDFFYNQFRPVSVLFLPDY
jgi:indoleamine 2,3-dioxygenase